jgi:hypothetical protein
MLKLTEVTIRSMDKSAATATVSIPLRWRPLERSPQSVGTLYQFIREHLCSHGGECSRDKLLSAMLNDPAIAARLARSQGFLRLLWNMHYSGWIEAPGHRIRATPKTLRRTAIPFA